MRNTRLVAAGITVLIGLFWIGQGSGLISGSGMSGSSFWEVVGVVAVVAGLVLAAREWMARTR